MHLSVVAGQFPVTLDIMHNLATITTLLHDIDAEEMLVLPEGALSGYDEDISFLHRIDQQRLTEALFALEETVKQRAAHLIFGSCLYEGGQWYNAGLYFSPSGKRFIYRKVNLATHERHDFTAGSQLPVFSIAGADTEFAAGMQLCRELRYPEQWRYLAQQGASIFFYLTNAVNPRQHMAVWRSHLISRAAENQRFVVSVNTAHPRQHCPTMIIAPDGEVLQEASGDKTILLRSTLDLADVADWYLNQSRSDIIGLYYHGR